MKVGEGSPQAREEEGKLYLRVNPPQFGRFLLMFTSLSCCGGGFEGVNNFDLSKRGKKEGPERPRMCQPFLIPE